MLLRMFRTLLTLTALVTAIGCAIATRTDRTIAVSGASFDSGDSSAALAAFGRVYQVATSDRCVNCHSTDDHPWQGDGNARHVHTMNVQRALSPLGGGNLGVSCTTCHGSSNWAEPHLPPGEPGTPWTMPTAAKGYLPSISAADLCAMWKDGDHNFFEDAAYFASVAGGHAEKRPRSGQDLIDHVTDSAGGLVAWSFDPGPGRALPPESHAAFVNDVTAWVQGGMPCPTN